MAIRVLVAPDKFKDCLTADQVGAAIAAGIASVDPAIEIDVVPMADGGEGTVAALIRATHGRMVQTSAIGPLSEPVESSFGVLNGGNTAVIEMAAASGLALVPRSKRDPTVATSAGVGDLIRAAFDQNVESIVVGIGGSATNDGGAGMAQRLGYRLLDRFGRNLPFGGGNLANLDHIDASGADLRIKTTRFVAACDVGNTICGPEGASAIFGPQKGADAAAVSHLDDCLRRLADVIQRDLGVAVIDLPGGGAAGGLGAGLVAFCNASLRRGFELVAEVVGLEGRIRKADLVITAEGRYDATSRFGKTTHGLCELADRFKIPALVLAGAVERSPTVLSGLSSPLLFSIAAGPSDLATSIRFAADNLTATAAHLIRVFLAGKNSGLPF